MFDIFENYPNLPEDFAEIVKKQNFRIKTLQFEVSNLKQRNEKLEAEYSKLNDLHENRMIEMNN